jgi:tripartite-type tricarboxylate transporter receptor subunit TctC
VLAGIVVAAGVASGDARGQAPPHPTRPVKLIVGQQPGSAPDVVARILADRLAELWGQPVIVDNRSGVGGTLAADAVAKAHPDGYTLLLGSQSALAIAPAVQADLRYDPRQDFAPVARIVKLPLFLTVRAALPVRSFAEYVAYAREHPGRLTLATLGPGTVPGIFVDVVRKAYGIDLVAVPYRGVAGALNDVLGGAVDSVLSDATQAQPHVQAGTLRFVGVTGTRRAHVAPDVPTLAEQGLAGFPIEAWQGIVVPAKTPPDVVAQIAQGVAQALATPAVRQRFEQLGYETIEETPAQFGAALRAEIERLAAMFGQAAPRSP